MEELMKRILILFYLIIIFIDSLAQQYFLQKFDTDPVLSPTQAPKTWYLDRYAPYAFEKAFFDGDNRLKHSISTVDAALNRPPGQQGTFYNIQGRKYDLNNPVYTSISADLYIGTDWQTNHRRADLWGTMADNSNTITRYPIIGFANTTGSNPTWRVWTNAGGGTWINLPDPPGFTYGAWYNLRIELTTTAFKYYINGLLVYTDTDIGGSTKFLNMIIQAYNFGDPALPPQNYALESYDVYWDNIAAGAIVKIVPNYHFQCDLNMITLHVDVEGVNDLFAFSVTVKFDNSVLQLTQRLDGTFLEANPGGSSVHYESFPSISSVYDSIIVDAAVLGIAGSSGSGRLFSLKFLPLVRNTAIVKIVSLSLRNSQNQEIYASTDSAKIVIAPSVSVDLTIENQSVVGSEFFFDVYLTRTGTKDLYLSNAEFVLHFNDNFFTSPSLVKVGTVPGFCTFVPTNSTPANDLATRTLYFNNTTTSIVNIPPNVLKITLSIPTPPDQSTFDNQIAKIDNTPNTHRLGRFKITGLTYTLGTSGLSWRLVTPHETYVNTFANHDPWCDYLAVKNAIDPPDIALSVELTSFTAKQEGNHVKLTWSTLTEFENTGFEIEKRLSSSEIWNKLAFIPGAGNSNSKKDYSFWDKSISNSGKYFYRLKQINFDNTYSYSDELEIDVNLILEYSLEQNYPNPFNPSTTITYSIPQDGFVQLKLFNLLGELVKSLVNEFQTAGIYKINFTAEEINSGIYFYKLETNGYSSIRKMTVIR